MARPAIATLLGLLGFILYVIAAVALADRIDRQWAVQLIYFILAGTLWVLPARWLMLWAAHRR
jgi:hypothetical protein